MTPHLVISLGFAAALAGVAGCSETSRGPTYPTTTGGSILPGQTYAISGTVIEPGKGPLAGVIVETSASWVDPKVAARSTLTDQTGKFLISGLPYSSSWEVPRSATLHFSKDGYEPRATPPWGGTGDLTLNTALQARIQIAAGQSLDGTLLTDDIGYCPANVEDNPCGKLIRVSVPHAGTLALRLAWSDPTVSLGLGVGDAFVRGSSELALSQVVTAGETIVYLNAPRLSANLGFRLDVALLP